LGTVALVTVPQGAWLYCLFIYGVSSVGFYGAVIFYDAFIVDVAKPSRRDWISSSGFAWGYIGGTIPFLACAAFYMKPEWFGMSGPVAGARAGFLLTALWWFGFSLPLFRNVRQVHHVPHNVNPMGESVVRIFSTLRKAMHHKNIFLFLAAFFLYIDGVHTIIKMAFAFGTDLGLQVGTLVAGLIVVQLVGFPFSLLYGHLAKRFGAKPLLLFGVATYALVTIVAFNLEHAWQFYLLTFLVGTAQGGVQSLSRSLYSRLIPREHAAEFFGFYDIFGKFAAVLGPSLVGISAQLTNSTRFGVLSLIVLFVAGSILLVFVKETRAAPEEVEI
jgi:MFS transporter, UMF1 family